jgi:fumarate reductase subunit C
MTSPPRWHRGMAGWWRRSPAFRAYLLREASSVAIAVYALMLLAGLVCLLAGPEAWAGWQAVVLSWPGLACQALVLVAALIHTTSWFRLLPLTVPRLGPRLAGPSDRAVRGLAWLSSLGLSLALLFWLMRGVA